MPQVVLITGDEPRFSAGIQSLTQYIERTIGKRNIISLSVANGTDRYLMPLLKKMPLCHQMVIIYHGHGNRIGWKNSCPYLGLALLLKIIKKQVFLINACCYAGAIIPYLKILMVPPSRVGILAESPGDEKAFGSSFFHELKKSWKKKMAYNPDFHTCRWSEILAREGISMGEKFTRLNALLDKEKRFFHRNTERWGKEFDYLFFPE